MSKMVNKMFDSRKYYPECNFGEEIVSYIYNEMDVADRSTFETHLADCGKCAEEVAAFSSVSFSVQEWRDTEFANLLTPKIEIPYETQVVTFESEVKVISWFDKIREIFTLSPMLLKTATAFGVLAITIGLVWFFIGNNSNKNIAGQENLEPKNDSKVVEEKDKPAQPQEEIVVKETIENPNLNETQEKEVAQQTPSPKQVKSEQKVKTISPENKPIEKKSTIAKNDLKSKSKPLKDGRTPKVIQEKQNNLELKQVPRLSEVAVENTEEEDLRLSDLFSDLDSDK